MGTAQLPKVLRGRKITWGMAARLLAGSLLAGLLAACSSGKHPAAAVVEAYMQALVDKDEPRLTSLTCESFESDALLELDAFGMVKTHLEDLDCQADVSGKNDASVTCQGQIIATYGAEDQTFDLSDRTYQVKNQGGDWLVCGQ